MIRIIFISFLISLCGQIFAVEPSEILGDRVLEARARALSSELRCVVCQGESIDASSADVAKDLRILVREKLTEGLTDAQIKDFLVERYGDFILLKPRFIGSGIWLWLIGPLLLLVAGFFVYLFIKKSGNIYEELE